MITKSQVEALKGAHWPVEAWTTGQDKMACLRPPLINLRAMMTRRTTNKPHKENKRRRVRLQQLQRQMSHQMWYTRVFQAQLNANKQPVHTRIFFSAGLVLAYVAEKLLPEY